MAPNPLFPLHGGYRHLKSFQVARLCYDVTVRFCDRYIEPGSRTHDQMVQAARSGVQNIAEGSKMSATSKELELKLTNVARSSLEELQLDYEDYLRHHELPLWAFDDPRAADLKDRRCVTAEEVAAWVEEVHRQGGSGYAEIAANGALVLIGAAVGLLRRQLAAQARAFKEDGGFRERLHRTRRDSRRRRRD